MIKEVWCEGDNVHRYTACHLGYGKGQDLLEVCNDLASRNDYFDKHFDRRTLKYWNTRLFLKEDEARECFG